MADVVITGARIRTLDERRPWASAVAMRDGVIVAVGDDDEIRRHATARTEHVDGRGMSIVPGLVDAHLHPLDGTDHTPGAGLGACRSLDDVRAALAAERDRAGSDGGWVLGHSLQYDAFGGAPITHEMVADVLGDRPAYLRFYDGHSALATPAALAIAGVDGPRQFTEAAEVVCDERGVPTGMLREPGAMVLVEDAVPKPSRAERLDLYARTLRAFNAAGLTGGHAMSGDADMLDDYRELEARGDLTFRTIVPLWQQPHFTDEQVEAQLPLRDEHGRLWRCGAAKFFLDGVIESGTAWMLEPGADGSNAAPFWPDPQRYAAVVARFAAAGFQCITHAIGDAAVRHALDAYRDAARAPRALHRVEHLEVLADADVPRFAAEGVAVSMQPIHTEGSVGDTAWARPLSDEQFARAWRTKDLLEAGAILALGSDWPVASYDPREGMAWSRLRRRPGDPSDPAITPEQALEPLATLHGYTTGPAAIAGESAVAGRIAEGFRADLTALAEDPDECDADALPDVPVRLTLVDGRIVFRGDDGP